MFEQSHSYLRRCHHEDLFLFTQIFNYYCRENSPSQSVVCIHIQFNYALTISVQLLPALKLFLAKIMFLWNETSLTFDSRARSSMTRHANFGNDMQGLHSITMYKAEKCTVHSLYFPELAGEKRKLCLHLFTIFSLKILPVTSVALSNESLVSRQNYATLQLRDKCKRTKNALQQRTLSSPVGSKGMNFREGL